mgnify:CR=1 FL=1
MPLTHNEPISIGQIRMIGLTSHQRSMAARISAGDIPPDKPAAYLDTQRPLEIDQRRLV